MKKIEGIKILEKEMAEKFNPVDDTNIYDAYDIVNKTEQAVKTTGEPSFDERMDFAERQKSMNPL